VRLVEQRLVINGTTNALQIRGRKLHGYTVHK